jgi:membrane protein DedA with SNARE-associated domain
MNEVIQFIIRNAYPLLFVAVLADQAGVPVPASPMLLAAGALAGQGGVRFLPSFLLGVAAALTGNVIWYWIGRKKGESVLSLLCRISLNPESCVRGTSTFFSRYGARSLLVAKFIPGFSTLAPPLAGVVRMPLASFLLYDSLGAGIWVGVLIGVGYAFSYELEALFESALKMGSFLAAALAGGLTAYLIRKYVRRRNFLRRIRTERIRAEELKEKMDRGDAPVILDVRNTVEFRADPRVIAGAVFASPEEFQEGDYARLREKEVIVYCS